MDNNNNVQPTVYQIPTNYTDASKLWGMFEWRNFIEACCVAIPIGALCVLLIKSLFWQIVCVMTVPLPIVVLLSYGIQGDSVSQFVVKYIKYKINRRTMYFKNAIIPETKELLDKTKKKKFNFDEWYDRFMGVAVNEDTGPDTIKSKYVHPDGSLQSFLLIKDFRDGVIITQDNRYVKILEITPINFLLRSTLEQEGIIYLYRQYLKVAPRNLQVRVISKKADLTDYIMKQFQNIETEESPKCRELIKSNIAMINNLGQSESVTRKFYLVFQYERGDMGVKSPTYAAVVNRINEEVSKAARYFSSMGNEVIIPENYDDFNKEVLEGILRKKAVQEYTGLDEDIE